MDISNIDNRRPRRSSMPEILPILVVDQLRWQAEGHDCVQHTTKTQGGLGADFGAYAVTTAKFSTRSGPASCSPPA